MPRRRDSKGYLSVFDELRENSEAILCNRYGKVSNTSENEDASATYVNYDCPTVYRLEDDSLNIINHTTQCMKALLSKSC